MVLACLAHHQQVIRQKLAQHPHAPAAFALDLTCEAMKSLVNKEQAHVF